MAFETGVASDYRDFYRKLVTFLTQNSELVAAGDQWQLTRGFMDPDIDYIDSVQYVINGPLNWDVSSAMGHDDSYSNVVEKSGERKIGWVARLVNAPNFIGFKSSTAVSPTYYTVTAEDWLGTTNTSSRQPKSWDIQYSDDNVAWATSDTVTDQTGWSPFEERQFLITETTPHKFWRLYVTANNGDGTYVAIGRLRFYDAVDRWISRGWTNEHMFRLNGFAGTDPAFCGMRLHINQNAHYNIEWMGATCHDPELGWETQPHQIQDRYSPLWEFDMQYWFVANGHRMICVMHVDERWIAASMGKFLPYGAVGQYPYTMLISGSRNSPISWVQEDSASHLQAPAQDHPGTYVYHPNNQSWIALQNRDYQGGLIGGSNVLSPTISGGMGVGNRQLPNGAYVLAPYIIEIGDRAYGQLDGMRWVSGDNQKSGDILDVCGQDWLIFHNQQYTGISDFAALELK